MSQDEPHKLDERGAHWATATASELTDLLEIDVSISPPTVRQGARDALIRESGTTVCASFDVEGENGAHLWIVLPLRGALVLAAARAGEPAEDFPDLEGSTFDGDVEEAFSSAMDVCAGSLRRVLSDESGLPAIELRETVAVDLGENDGVLPDASYRCAEFEFEAAGFPKESLRIVFPADLANQWFGEQEESETAEDAEPVDLSVAIIDASEESREDFSLLAAQLGARVVAIDPRDVFSESMDVFEDIRWAVVSWDIGGHSGLDLVERLRRNAATAHLEFAISSPAPTRAMVEAALRWGVRTMLYKPWDKDEILTRLSVPPLE